MNRNDIITLGVLGLIIGCFFAVAVHGGIVGPLGLLIGFVAIVTLVVVLARSLAHLWRRS